MKQSVRGANPLRHRVLRDRLCVNQCIHGDSCVCLFGWRRRFAHRSRPFCVESVWNLRLFCRGSDGFEPRPLPAWQVGIVNLTERLAELCISVRITTFPGNLQGHFHRSRILPVRRGCGCAVWVVLSDLGPIDRSRSKFHLSHVVAILPGSRQVWMAL
jgi:hypothetical protein